MNHAQLGIQTALAVLIFAPIMSFAVSACRRAYLDLAEQGVIESLLSQELGTKVSKNTSSRNTLRFDRTNGVLQLDDVCDTFANSLREEAKDRDKAFREALEDFLKKNKIPVSIVFPNQCTKEHGVGF